MAGYDAAIRYILFKRSGLSVHKTLRNIIENLKKLMEHLPTKMVKRALSSNDKGANSCNASRYGFKLAIRWMNLQENLLTGLIQMKV